MAQSASSRNLDSMKTTLLAGATGLAAAVLIAGAAMVMAPQSASALPAYAQKTGKACGFCHVRKTGGGPLTANGKKFKANGHKF